jgi:NAD-dependent dihydropyrimidine dehydrogenase PreA subunit
MKKMNRRKNMIDAAYIHIAEKINENPIMAPKSENGAAFHPSFIKYLKLVYAIEEADLLQHFPRPNKFISTQEVAEISGKEIDFVERVLSGVHKRNGIMGMGNLYCLPGHQLLLNMHQFYPDIKPEDIEAAKLYREFFIEGGFYKNYESSFKGTPLMRVIPVGKAIDTDQKKLTAEEAHDFILNHAPEELALVPCPCRTRSEKMGNRECKDKFPIGTCIFMGPLALHFEAQKLGKRVTKQQAVSYFDEMQDLGLVGMTDNSVSDGSVICLCCECCCSQIRGRTRWDNPDAVLESNFVPYANDDCVGCGTCMERCFFNALSVDDDTGRAVVEPEKCIGCGICTFVCPQEALKLHRKERSKPFETVRELIKTVATENRDANE